MLHEEKSKEGGGFFLPHFSGVAFCLCLSFSSIDLGAAILLIAGV